MSTPNANQPTTQQALQAVASLSAQVLRMATAVNTKMASAPKTADAAQLEKTAAALIDCGWTPGMDKAAVVKLLADPQTALVAFENLAVKAAQEISGGGDPRLVNGRATGEKTAGTESNPFGLGHAESEADKMYAARLKAYQHNGSARR